MNLFNANFNPIINGKRFFHLGIAAGLLTFFACGQQGNSLGMKDKLVCVLPGMKRPADHAALNALAKGITSDDADVECVPVNWNAASMEDILKESADFINDKQRTGNYDQLLVGGHSLGGVLATHLATHGKLSSGVKGSFTISSPMNGIMLTSQDLISQSIARRRIGNFCDILTPGSQFLQDVRSGVVNAYARILSFGSRCQLSPTVNMLLNFLPGLRANLLNTDGAVHIDSQLAAKDWGTNTEVVSYDELSHDTNLQAFNISLTEAPCVLEYADMHQRLNLYIEDPDSTIERSLSQNQT